MKNIIINIAKISIVGLFAVQLHACLDRPLPVTEQQIDYIEGLLPQNGNENYLMLYGYQLQSMEVLSDWVDGQGLALADIIPSGFSGRYVLGNGALPHPASNTSSSAAGFSFRYCQAQTNRWYQVTLSEYGASVTEHLYDAVCPSLQSFLDFDGTLPESDELVGWIRRQHVDIVEGCQYHYDINITDYIADQSHTEVGTVSTVSDGVISYSVSCDNGGHWYQREVALEQIFL